MEKRILGIILSVVGVVGLIYAGITFMNGGSSTKNIKAIIFSGVLGAIFFTAGIGLIKNTKDKPPDHFLFLEQQTTVMRAYIIILTFLLLCFSACTVNNCNLNNISKINWNKLDSVINYKLCNASNIKLTEKDSVVIEYLGALNKKGDALIQQPSDSAFFYYSTNTHFGKYIKSDPVIPAAIARVISLMTQGSEGILQFDLSKFTPMESTHNITLYFISSTDSIAAINCVTRLLNKDVYDSLVFTSAESAIKKYNGQSDTTWKSILQFNPLPVSMDIFIKSKYYAHPFADSIKKSFLKDKIVSEVMLPAELSLTDTFILEQFRKDKYLVRIRS